MNLSLPKKMRVLLAAPLRRKRRAVMKLAPWKSLRQTSVSLRTVLIVMVGLACEGNCYSQEDDATPATREEIAACQSEYEAHHAVEYPLRRALSDKTWAEWSSEPRLASKLKLHQPDRDRDLAGEHDLYVFNLGDRDRTSRKGLISQLAEFKHYFSQYRGNPSGRGTLVESQHLHSAGAARKTRRQTVIEKIAALSCVMLSNFPPMRRRMNIAASTISQ